MDFNCYGDIQYYFLEDLALDSCQRAFRLPPDTRYYNPKKDYKGFGDFTDYRGIFKTDLLHNFLDENLKEFAFRHAEYFDRVSGQYATDNLEFYLNRLKWDLIDNSIHSLFDADRINISVQEAIQDRYCNAGYSDRYFISISYIQNPYYFQTVSFDERVSFKSSENTVRYILSKAKEVDTIKDHLFNWDLNIKLTHESLSRETDINPRSVRRRLNEDPDLKDLYKYIKAQK